MIRQKLVAEFKQREIYQKQNLFLLYLNIFFVKFIQISKFAKLKITIPIFPP